MTTSKKDDKTSEEVTFQNPEGIKATVKIHWVGKYHYWLEINGCQETKTQSIPNPWMKVGGRKTDLNELLTSDEIEKLRKAEAERLKIK